MRVLQGSFPCCKKRLPSNKDKRWMVLECIICIHNFRTEKVGHNQIAEVFNPEYECVVNIYGYNCIRRYYLEPGDYDTDNEAEIFEENFGGDSDRK